MVIGGSGNITASAFARRISGLEDSVNPAIKNSDTSNRTAAFSNFSKISNDNIGFQGCIRNLVINDRTYRFGLEPAGDALQGFDIGIFFCCYFFVHVQHKIFIIHLIFLL